MRNQYAAVTRRLSDPDFQASLVSRCLALAVGMGALLGISLIHDAYVWLNPVEPRYFFVDGKSPPRPARALDSPILDDTELLEWAVKAVVAPYNVDYFNYPIELNTASRRFTAKGWNTFAKQLHRTR
jgi:intracellular multiplication protein IcmL